MIYETKWEIPTQSHSHTQPCHLYRFSQLRITDDDDDRDIRWWNQMKKKRRFKLYIHIYLIFCFTWQLFYSLSLLWLSFPVSLSDSIDLTLLFHLTLVFLISSSCLWYPCLIYLKYTVFASCQMPFCRETHTNGMKWKKSSIHLRHTTQPWRWSSLDIKKYNWLVNRMKMKDWSQFFLFSLHYVYELTRWWWTERETSPTLCV